RARRPAGLLRPLRADNDLRLPLRLPQPGRLAALVDRRRGRRAGRAGGPPGERRGGARRGLLRAARAGRWAGRAAGGLARRPALRVPGLLRELGPLHPGQRPAAAPRGVAALAPPRPMGAAVRGSGVAALVAARASGVAALRPSGVAALPPPGVVAV